MFDLSGKTALVTGGSRGLGLFIAEGFVQAGVKVYVSSRKVDACSETAARLSEHGSCLSLPADLSTAEGVSRLSAAVLEREPRLDILINNAGATWGAPVDEFPESGWDRVMDLNVRSIFFLTQQLLPALRAAGRPVDPARVVNIGSVAGLRPGGAENYPYSASKAAVHMLTRHLASRLAREHVNVNAIAPGPFATKMMAFALEDEASRERVERSIPLGRVGGPEDISGVAQFLCSRASAYMTGAVLPLDGGLTAG